MREEVEPWLRRAALELGLRVPTRAESSRLARSLLLSEAREIALAIADGSVPVIEGVVCLARTRSRLSLNHEETWDAFLPFVGSETDHLPLASERCNLNVESLRAKDEESRAYEERLRPALIADCATLVAAIEREAAYAPEFIVDGD